MSRNRIQLQYGFGLFDFEENFPDEESCRKHVRKCKWPKGYSCRHCGHERAWVFTRGASRMPHWKCRNCHKRESLIAGTLFEHTLLPLRTWFLAMQLLTQAKTSISALELHRQLHVNDKTALLLKHKIMEALGESESERKLHGRIELEELYLEGKPKRDLSEKGELGTVSILAAVETDSKHHPLKLVLTPVKSLCREEVRKWSQIHVAQRSTVLTDALDCFLALENCAHCRFEINRSGNSLADENFKWVNTLISNLQSSFRGALHAFDFKRYARRYLAFYQFRFNRRFNLEECFFEMIKTTVKSAAKPRKYLQVPGAG